MKEKDLEFKNANITQLSENTFRDLCTPEKQAEAKKMFFIVQVNEVKVFKEDDKKKNIKQRYSLYK